MADKSLETTAAQSPVYDITLHLVDGTTVVYEAGVMPFITAGMTFLVPYKSGEPHIAVPASSIVKAVSRPRKVTQDSATAEATKKENP
jgi:hypothetical protein